MLNTISQLHNESIENRVSKQIQLLIDIVGTLFRTSTNVIVLSITPSTGLQNIKKSCVVVHLSHIMARGMSHGTHGLNIDRQNT